MKPRRSRKRTASPPVLIKLRGGFRWDQVELEPYKLSMQRAGEFRGASRQVLVGKRGERVSFHVRYFELDARGFTSLERHHHSHVVIGVRGRGMVRVGADEYPLRPLDTIYIGPDKPHQLRASGAGRFGFFCIVDAKRDRPRPIATA
ncbi:MAG: cupin domain-containing protein [Candidatus Binataceae bacterium]